MTRKKDTIWKKSKSFSNIITVKLHLDNVIGPSSLFAEWTTTKSEAGEEDDEKKYGLGNLPNKDMRKSIYS